jgi:phage terminase large subunit
MYQFEYTQRQQEALSYLSINNTDCELLLFGGAAGGGKSYLGCAWQISRRLKYANTRGLIGRCELKKLKQTTMKTFWKICVDIGLVKDIHYTYNQQEQTIKFFNGSEIVLMDLRDMPSDVEFTRLGSLEITDYFVDEVAEVSKRAIEILDSRVRYNLIDDKPKGLMTCNPTKGWLYNEFFDAHRSGNLRFDRAFIRSLPDDNPHLPQSYLDKLSRLSERDRKRLKDGDWDYDDSNDRLYHYDDLLRCFRDEIVGNKTKYITADIAALGNDKTIIGLWDGMTLLEIHKLEHKYPNEVADYIRQLSIQHNVRLSNIVVDADGLGIGVVGILKCQAFNNGGRSTEPEIYLNLKSECYFKISDDIANNSITFICKSYKSDIIKELEVVRNYTANTEKRRQVTPKDEIKRMNGFSPDIADMIMMRKYFDLYPNYRRYGVR